jgi:hypothetical protein
LLRRPVRITGVVHLHGLFHLAVLARMLLHWRFTWQFAGPHHSPGGWGREPVSGR